ncbi:Uncharacterised protein [Mycobacteroides abscessus subsp. abscessus]|nr:Uncharacterised protein [Mycobacteroides abscessus subsp. abscessus]
MIGHAADRNTLLGHLVAVANGDGVVFERVEIDCDAERGTDLVLSTIPPADCPGVIEVDIPALAQLGGQRLGPRAQVGIARQRQYRDLDRGQPRIQPQHRTGVHAALGVRRLVLVVRINQEGHEGPGQTGRRLNHVRGVPAVLGLIVVRQILTGMLCVRG